MKTAHRQAAQSKPRYVDDFPSDEPEAPPDDDWWRDFQPWPMPAPAEQQTERREQ